MTEGKNWSSFDGEVKGHQRHPGGKCQVSRLLEGLPDDGRRAVEKVLADDLLSAAAIEKALRERLGAAPSRYSIANHRRKGCRCTR